MRRGYALLLIVFLFTVSSHDLYAKTKSKTKNIQQAKVLAPKKKVKKQPRILASVMEKKILSNTSNYCNKESHWMKCYNISQKKCQTTFQSNLKRCFAENNFRKIIPQAEALQYGQEIGVCVSKKNRSSLWSKRKVCATQ